MSISRLKCLSGGISSERIPLSEGAVPHISLYMSTCGAFPSELTPTLTKMLAGVKVKHILGYNESSILLWNLCSQISSVFKKWIVCDYEVLTEDAQGGKCSQGRYIAFATNAIYQYVKEQHHVMLLQAIYSFVRDGMTFDQCVWPCITLLPPHVSDEAFFLCGDKGAVHPLCTLNVGQIAFAP